MLSRLVPGPLVRWFARPYVAGGSLAEGLDVAAARFQATGALTTLDLLGEAVDSDFQVLANIAAYEQLVDALGSDPRFADPARRPSISLKPSAFTNDYPDEAREPIERIVQRAQKRGVAVTIDMEDRSWTDRTLDWAIDWFRRGYDVGTVLQTRLNRTVHDLPRVPPGMRLRLVIGIYPEPAAVALTAKPQMKERMLAYAATLLRQGVFVEFGTHDEPVLERFCREVAPLAPDRCEIQMLLGVPREHFGRRLAAGELGPVVPLRLYVPFARSWDDATAYLRRRMQESPSMMWLVARNLLRARRR